MISKLQYISQGSSAEEHLLNIKNALAWGCDWIQLRLKNSSEEEVLETALLAKTMCDSHHAILIINDHVKVAMKSKAHGVHLGKSDIKPAEAREVLGANFIIGGTANTLSDCLELHQQKVDYIGLGPFRFTQTKANLSPILGVNGYKNILLQLDGKNIKTPIIAIGGIGKDDLTLLKETGVHGVAASKLLTAEIDKIPSHHQIETILK